LPGVINAVSAVHPHVLVVDDGSADLPDALFVPCIRHRTNLGKGAAIMTGAAEAGRLGMTHILTIDADGQHDARDIPAFIRAGRRFPTAIIVGVRDFAAADVPFSSRFGRSFSNFWYKVHTGTKTGDVQSGFRLYPLAVLENVLCSETRYSFEVEILVRANWAGFPVTNIPVRVHYPPKNERVSHFRPFLDNMRISLLNTRLTIRAVMPVPQRKFAVDKEGRVTVLSPLRSLKALLSHDATPKSIALGAATGAALGTLPLVGLHSIAVLLAAGAIKANKIVGLAASQLCIPPFVPALCIEAGHYMRHGRFLTEISLQTLGYEALQRLWEWLLGALVLAPVFALLFGGITWLLALLVRRSLKNIPSGKGSLSRSGE
jgi:uncharacterized protein (DUF2062 family)